MRQMLLFDLPPPYTIKRDTPAEDAPPVRVHEDLGTIRESTLSHVHAGLASNFRWAVYWNEYLTFVDWNELLLAGYIEKDELGDIVTSKLGNDYLNERYI